jgi:hypothetical protein
MHFWAPLSSSSVVTSAMVFQRGKSSKEAGGNNKAKFRAEAERECQRPGNLHREQSKALGPESRRHIDPPIQSHDGMVMMAPAEAAREHEQARSLQSEQSRALISEPGTQLSPTVYGYGDTVIMTTSGASEGGNGASSQYSHDPPMGDDHGFQWKPFDWTLIDDPRSTVPRSELSQSPDPSLQVSSTATSHKCPRCNKVFTVASKLRYFTLPSASKLRLQEEGDICKITKSQSYACRARMVSLPNPNCGVTKKAYMNLRKRSIARRYLASTI